TAYVARAVPELRLDLPPTAIGKDYLPGGEPVALSPSGTGLQVSVFGLLGVMAAWEEGVEVNVLGLTFGVAVKHPALKLPAVGRRGMPYPGRSASGDLLAVGIESFLPPRIHVDQPVVHAGPPRSAQGPGGAGRCGRDD